MDSAQCPELFEGDLDRAGAVAFFADLAACAEVQQIRTRGDRGLDQTTATLGNVRDRLLSGELTAVQIVYRFRNEGWCDTLMRGTEGFRLIRVRHELLRT